MVKHFEKRRVQAEMLWLAERKPATADYRYLTDPSPLLWSSPHNAGTDESSCENSRMEGYDRAIRPHTPNWRSVEPLQSLDRRLRYMSRRIHLNAGSACNNGGVWNTSSRLTSTGSMLKVCQWSCALSSSKMKTRNQNTPNCGMYIYAMCTARE